jgi:hypothetical protein
MTLARSWMDIVASTTPGVGRPSTVRAEVKVSGSLPRSKSGQYRLVVQSFDAEGDARPVGSTQRSVTPAELREGISVNLLELRNGSGIPPAPESEPVVVAWIEEGKADLELDARGAKPSRKSLHGLVPRGEGAVLISLRQRAA